MAEAVHDPGGGKQGDEGAAEKGDGDGKPGGAEKREVGDDADAGGDEEQTEPAEETVGDVLEFGLGVAAAKDVPGGEENHAEDRAGDLEMRGGAQGFAGELEEQKDEDGLEHRHGMRLHQGEVRCGDGRWRDRGGEVQIDWLEDVHGDEGGREAGGGEG